MGYAEDRAFFALAGLTQAPSPSTRAGIISGALTDTLVAPPPLTITTPKVTLDPLETTDTKRALFETLVPLTGAAAVLSVSRDLAGIVPGQGGGPGPFGSRGSRNASFLLTSVRENQQERYQIYQTFQDYILYTMGQAPSIYNFSGYLPNSSAGSGSSSFMAFYNGMRASSLSGAGRTASLSYLSTTVTGYILSMRIGHAGERPGASEFSFDLLLSATR